jgi:hypothetical protein
MATADSVALRKRRQVPIEHVTLAGPFAHRRYEPRRAVRARFEHWRIRLLAASYARVPLLCGLRGAL